MRKNRFERARRAAARTLLICTLALAIGGAIACPYAGHYLIVSDPLEPSDVILVLAGPRTVRWLEAIDLYRDGMAPQIVLSPGIVYEAEIYLRSRGIDYPAEVELVRSAMIQLGVPANVIGILPSAGRLDNTADEALAMKQLARDRAWRSIIVVTSKYHTRRTRFAFQRDFANTDIRVRITGSRYDGARPDGWWRSRPDLRYVISELQKLLAYRLGLDR